MSIVRFYRPPTDAKVTIRIIEGHYVDDHQLKIEAHFTALNVKQIDNKYRHVLEPRMLQLTNLTA